MTKKQQKKLDRAFSALRELYASIPDTKGCMDHIKKPKSEGGCNGQCCRIQCPSALYVEFLYAWEKVLKWPKNKIADLIEACMGNYLSDNLTKGCVFFDSKKNLCMQHETRPFNCFLYGIIPEEEFKPRIERLRKEFENVFGAVFMDQCNLVSTIDGRKVTVSMSNRWWKKLINIEESIGINRKDIHDNIGGSYRTYHDHILLQVCTDAIMRQLQFLKLHGKKEEKDIAIEGLMKGLRKTYLGQNENSNSSTS